MPLQIIRNDITKVSCDAIVNAAKNSLLGGGGVDGAIHNAAGSGLLAECRTLGGCPTGEARITGGYDLPAKYVIHTVGPVWQDGHHGEPELLRQCYESCLALALEHKLDSIAFPLISAGTFGYPKEQAFKLAVDVLGRFALHHDMTLYLVVYGAIAYNISRKMFADIQAFIDDRYVQAHPYSRSAHMQEPDACLGAPPPCPARAAPIAPEKKALPLENLTDLLDRLDESFSQMLLRKIDEAGMTDSQCYKKANIDRKLFSKIRNDIHYKPSKPTVLAFAIALELSLEETKGMLEKAGYALSHASKADIIVEYFIRNKNYDIFALNEALFAFDQSLLGG